MQYIDRQILPTVEGLTEGIYKVVSNGAFFAGGINHLGFKNKSTWQQLRNLQSFKGSLNQSGPYYPNKF